MKHYILKSFSMLCIAISVVSCSSGDDEPPTPPFESTSITVQIPATADEVGDDNTGTYVWSSSDKLSLQYQRSDESGYTATLFSSQSSTKGGNFSGSLWSWEGAKSLYATYNRSDKQDSRTITSNCVEVSLADFATATPSIANNNAVTARNMGFMVAQIDGAQASGADSYNISGIEFNQVASYIQLQFSGEQKANSKVTSFELAPTNGQNKLFVSRATVSMATGKMANALEATHSITSAIDGGEATSGKYLTMPIFPADISEKLTLKTFVEGVGTKVGWVWSYTYEIPGINFKQNEIVSFPLDWSTMPESVVVSVTTANDLKDMAANNQSPEGDNWIIACTNENTQGAIENLNTILSNGNIEQGSVAVELPTVTELPKNSFAGAGVGTSSNNAALGAVKLPNVTIVGEAAFKDNTSVKEVTLGAGADKVTLQPSVFEGCTALESCTVKTAELPKSVFKGCKALKSVDLEIVNTIGESSFEDCTSLFKESANPVAYMSNTRAGGDSELVLSAVKNINSRAFYNCTQFSVLKLNETSGVVLETIAEDAFSFLNDGTTSSFTSQITLYIPSSMSTYVDIETNSLTIAGVTLSFKNIFVDGVDPDYEQSKKDDTTGTGEDANVENIG